MNPYYLAGTSFQPYTIADARALLAEFAAVQAGFDAAYAAQSNGGLTATSTTSVTIGTGTKTFAIPAGKGFAIGQYVMAASQANPTNFVRGQIVSPTNMATGTLVISVIGGGTGGSGTYADWSIGLDLGGSASTYLLKAGDTMTGPLILPNVDPSAANEATRKSYVDTLVASSVAAGVAPKAPLVSPSFTGTPNAPTPSAGSNNTQIATTAYADAAVATAIDGIVIFAETPSAGYSLNSGTLAAQKIFGGASTNGTVTLATGVYEFRMHLVVTGMSGSSGNAGIDILGAGSATLARTMFTVLGSDPTGSIWTPGAVSEAHNSTGSNAIVAPAVTATTGTVVLMEVFGSFEVTSAGTIIPSISLQALSAAVVVGGSHMVIRRLGNTGTNTKGNWS